MRLWPLRVRVERVPNLAWEPDGSAAGKTLSGWSIERWWPSASPHAAGATGRIVSSSLWKCWRGRPRYYRTPYYGLLIVALVDLGIGARGALRGEAPVASVYSSLAFAMLYVRQMRRLGL